MTSKSSRKLSDSKPRTGNNGTSRQTVIKDASETKDEDRDLAHGEGGTIGLPTKPGDLSQDD